MNALFVCSRNRWRSPTAEVVFRKLAGFNVRSAGTSASARRRVCANHIEWADVVFVMEEKHESRLRSDYPRLMSHKRLHVLDIPDEYGYMEPELVAELERAVRALLDVG